MRKFSLISESIINQDELESILNDSEFEYTILDDYYANGGENVYFFKNPNDLEENDLISKIIVIDSKISKSSIDIEGYNNPPFNFRSSGFYSINNIEDASEKYKKIFQITDKLKKYSPKLIIHEGKFVITLLGEKVDKSDLELSSRMKRVLPEIKSELEQFANQKGNEYLRVYSMDINGTTTIFLDFINKSTRSARPVFKNHKELEDVVLRVTRTLESHRMWDTKRKWMQDYEEIDELVDIRDSVNTQGFFIELVERKSSDDLYRFEIKLINYL